MSARLQVLDESVTQSARRHLAIYGISDIRIESLCCGATNGQYCSHPDSHCINQTGPFGRNRVTRRLKARVIC